MYQTETDSEAYSACAVAEESEPLAGQANGANCLQCMMMSRVARTNVG
jgi:hypothetical protein